MFANFEEAFLKKNEIYESIPDEILKSLSEKLPEGFEYKNIGYDACGIIPTSSQTNISMKIELPENFNPSSINELTEYMYRTQCRLRVIPDENGCIPINGQKFKVNDLIKIPLDSNKKVGEQLYISPPQFQLPFKVKIEADKIKKDVLIQRQPYADMHKSYFKNVDNSVFVISYILNEEENSIKFTFNVNIEKSNNVKEIIDGLKLYESCINGKLVFAGLKFSMIKNEDKAIEETIQLWTRISKIEDTLKVKFKVEFPTEKNDFTWIEKLYMSFIEKKPYKQYIDINKITIKNMQSHNKEELINNKSLVLNYIQNVELEIWGVKLNLYDSISLFNFRISDMVLTNKILLEYELLLEPTNNEGIYQSVCHFIKKEEAESYRNSAKDLENAELISIH